MELQIHIQEITGFYNFYFHLHDQCCETISLQNESQNFKVLDLKIGIYIYACIYIFIYIHARIYTHMYIHVYVHIHMYVHCSN